MHSKNAILNIIFSSAYSVCTSHLKIQLKYQLFYGVLNNLYQQGIIAK